MGDGGKRKERKDSPRGSCEGRRARPKGERGPRVKRLGLNYLDYFDII